MRKGFLDGIHSRNMPKFISIPGGVSILLIVNRDNSCKMWLYLLFQKKSICPFLFADMAKF